MAPETDGGSSVSTLVPGSPAEGDAVAATDTGAESASRTVVELAIKSGRARLSERATFDDTELTDRRRSAARAMSAAVVVGLSSTALHSTCPFRRRRSFRSGVNPASGRDEAARRFSTGAQPPAR